MGGSWRMDRSVIVRRDETEHACSRSGTLLLAAALAAVALVGSALPVAAVDHSAPVQVSDDAKAPEGRLIVVWRKSVDTRVSARIAGVRREVRGPNPRRSLVIAEPGHSAAVAAALRADPGVISVTVDILRQLSDFPTTPPDDPYFAPYQADLLEMRVPTAWLTTTGSPSQVVAVLDTGMDRSHVDLDDIPVVSPWNAITGTTDVTDTVGHGSHVIGEIAAETNNGLGVAGIAPGVTIMPVKVCGGTGCWTSDVDNGIDWARLHGATVINMSLGGPVPTPFEQSVITDAYNAGVTIVAAAGNDGDGTIDYPASYANVLSVAATDNGDGHASFSNANAAVDLAAPGVGILSTVPGGYTFYSGTSMSSPHVAAVAALVRSAHPTYHPAQVELALRSTAVDLGSPGRDDVFGSGRVDAAGAVAYVGSDTTRPTIAHRSPSAGKTGVDRDGNVKITFSEDVLHLSKTTVRLVSNKTGSVLRLKSFKYNATTHVLTLDPYSRLRPLKTYRVEVRFGITDLAGNTLATKRWTFKTGRR